ncbi:MAG: hypothetical protein AB7V62_09430, partial [Thermoleophilia bacterium]
KLHEEVLRGTAADLAAAVTEPPLGVVAVVVAAAPGAGEGDGGQGAADDALRAALETMIDGGLGAGRAAEAVAALGAAARNRAYRLALEVAEERRRAT